MSGLSLYATEKLLNFVFRDATASPGWTPPSVRAIRLHTGPPDDNGSINLATEDIRKAVSFGIASSGDIYSSSTVQWTNFDAGGTSQVITHWSLWDSLGTLTGGVFTGGNCLATGAFGNIKPFNASVNAASTATFTATGHGLAAGNTVQLYPLPGTYLPSGIMEDTAYTVAASPAPTATTFALSGVNTSSGSGGTVIVQRYIGRTISQGDTVTIASGLITIYAD